MKREQCIVGLAVCVLASSKLYAIERVHHPWFSKRHPVASVAKPAASAELRAPVLNTPAAAPDLQPTVVRRVSHPIAALPQHHVSLGEAIAKQALRYRGVRYRFGGTTKKGIDCSGLITRVYNDLKLGQVPRTSRDLFRMGKPVSLSELRPGDLVFFKNTYRRGISHVGVYAGGNRFIHARERHGVAMTSLADPYFQLHYAGARRIY